MIKKVKIKWGFVLLALLAIPVISYATYPLGDEFILYEFENDVTNSGSGGSTYDSALSGSAAFTSSSKVGDAAVTFGASGDYVDTKYGTGTNPTTQSLSFSFWVNKTLACGSGNDDHVFGVSVGSGKRMYIRCRLNNWAYRLGNNAAVDSGVAANIGSWDHVVLVLDSSDDIADFYVNGSLTGTSSIPSYTFGGDLWIGNFNEGGAAGSEGASATMDEVAIYTRALSSAEVTTIYTESQYNAPSAPQNLEGYSFESGVYLTWLPVSSINGQAVTDYRIQYKLSSSGTWSTFTDGTSTNRYTTVTGLTSGSSYDFRVQATNSLGTGTSSNTVTKTPASSVISFIATTTPSGNSTSSTLTVDFNASTSFAFGQQLSVELRNASNTLIDSLTTTTFSGAYNLENLTTIIDDQNLSLGADTSAVTYATTTDTLFTIHNSNGSIDEIDRNGTVIRTITCSSCGDTEGLEWLSSTLDSAGLPIHSFMMSQEGNSEFYEITISSSTTSYTRGTSYDLGLGDLANLGLEGLAYDAENDVYYAVREKTSVALYEVDLNGAPDVTSICTGQLGGISDLSDVDFSNGKLYLLSHESQNVTEVTLNPCTVTTRTLNHGMTQAEGITWDTEGRNLFIVGEPDQLSRYEVTNLNASSTFSNTVSDGTYTLKASITDKSGNTSSSTTRTYTVDATQPTPTITSSLSSPTSATTIPITINFGEDVNGFVVSDITISNASISDFAGGSQTYTANLTPITFGAITVNISAGVATDTVNFSNLAATEFSITYEEDAPVVPITGGYAAPIVTQQTTIAPSRIDEIINLLKLLGITPPTNLETLLNSKVPAAGTCPRFTQFFRTGESGEEVRNIQLFLNSVLGTDLPGTTLYGPLTTEAAKDFQEQNASYILEPWGLTESTGWWYQSTVHRANELSGCTTSTQLDNGVTLD